MAQLNYCPRCANPLTTKHDGGRDRQACPDEGCGFIHFGDFSIGCSGVVLREEDGETKALLVQRGQNPFAGSWQLPGGYAEHDEPLSLAVEREVEEEAGVIAKVRDVVAFRHSLGGSIGGPSTNIYMIFRLDLIEGEPRYDGVEIADAGFFSLAEMERMEAVQTLSRWGIEQALITRPGSGLSPDSHGPGADRPGWQLFGLESVDPAVWRR
jgi:ADP-ribose pyrophosphatase YjhB (NUDIX family)